MRLLFLGTGTSQGVPMIGCDCAVCASADPRDRRCRSSLLIQGDRHILIDSGPDLRMQALARGVKRLDAVVYTHCHNDHVMGFDDLRRFCEMTGRPLPVYGSAATLTALQRVFPYAFDPALQVSTYVKAEPHEVVADREFHLGDTGLIPLTVPHGNTPTFGYIITVNGERRAAYLPDCTAMTEAMAERLRAIPLLIIDGLRERPHPTHLNISGAIAAARRVGARQTLLTHLTHHVSHADRAQLLPAGVALAYDGLALDL
ncbi:MAG: MBL fold metallo-hydrolase [Verrucomicrobiales bacterium]|jgi:phosphoribosyl 1,2-cyclic phosphate phosphodiesterase|nr:MBL fold metallo-hydrolase [Verrucomicrobiales bacterium]